MSLIEQLGGYEKAKLEFDKTSADQWGYKFSLQMELLAYRRENNIFEVGDKVLHGSYRIEIFDIVSIRGDVCSISSDEISILKIGVDLENIRHATPQEIEAGRRL